MLCRWKRENSFCESVQVNLQTLRLTLFLSAAVCPALAAAQSLFFLFLLHAFCLWFTAVPSVTTDVVFCLIWFCHFVPPSPPVLIFFPNISVMIILLNSLDCVTKFFFSSAGMRRLLSTFFFACCL